MVGVRRLVGKLARCNEGRPPHCSADEYLHMADVNKPLEINGVGAVMTRRILADEIIRECEQIRYARAWSSLLYRFTVDGRLLSI